MLEESMLQDSFGIKTILLYLYTADWGCRIHRLQPCGGVKAPIKSVLGGARGVMVIVIGNGHDDTSSIPGRDWLHFT